MKAIINGKEFELCDFTIVVAGENRAEDAKQAINAINGSGMCVWTHSTPAYSWHRSKPGSGRPEPIVLVQFMDER